MTSIGNPQLRERWHGSHALQSLLHNRCESSAAQQLELLPCSKRRDARWAPAAPSQAHVATLFTRALGNCTAGRTAARSLRTAPPRRADASRASTTRTQPVRTAWAALAQLIFITALLSCGSRALRRCKSRECQDICDGSDGRRTRTMCRSLNREGCNTSERR